MSVKSTPERTAVSYTHLDYVVKNTEYQLDSPDNQNMSSVFLNGKSACAGYAKSLVYLLRQSGMEAMYVTGTTGGVAHAFVMARIDGELYYIDPTMDDTVFEEGQSDFTTYVNSPYLCVTTEMLKVSHTIDEDYYPLPVCDSTDANYHAVQGLLFNENSAQTRDALREALRTAVENKHHLGAAVAQTDHAGEIVVHGAADDVADGDGDKCCLLYTSQRLVQQSHHPGRVGGAGSI